MISHSISNNPSMMYAYKNTIFPKLHQFKMRNFQCLIVLVFLASYCECNKVIEIKKYHVKINKVNYEAGSISGLYTIAEKNGLIPGPLFHKYTLRDYKHLANNSLEYHTVIEDKEVINYENVNLVLEGVDTVADVFLDNKQIAQVNNMFVRYVIDIKDYLKKTTQHLKILIHSPLEEARSLHAKLNYTIPQECPNAHYNGDCYVNLLRKMQASFSWDWGPSVPSMGIWKPAYIEGYNESVIRDVTYDVEDLNGTHWRVNLDVYLANNKRNHVDGEITVNFLEQYNTTTVSIEPNDHKEMVFVTNFLVEKIAVKRWWPNGYGDQPLYTLKVTFNSLDKKDTSEKTVRVGFRTVELVQDEVQGGLTFYFKVNNVPVFLKGSNLIPIDIRPELGQDKDKVRKIFQVAKDQHMNTMRVWGGGVYESDYLYDLADEYGIMVWQDFMFACNLYQSDTTFLGNVLEEVRAQVKRLSRHTSILLLAGNNENEGVLIDNWYSYSYNLKDVYYEDYRKLYVETVKTEYQRLTHNRGLYLTSSPSNGKISENSKYGVSDSPGSYLYGDVHNYDIVKDSFDPNTYPITRLTSEYGYQAMPCVESFLKDTDNASDLYWNSNFMLYRQHHPGSNGEGGQQAYYNLVALNLKYPDASNKHFDEAYIYYSQIVQAVSMKVQTQRYRNYRSIQLADGRGLTMGALYWQINDVWVTPSWSSIDFYGRWKMLQYYVYDFFSPVLITGELTTSDDNVRKLDVFVVTDVDNLEEAQATIEVYKWRTLGAISEDHVPVTLQKGNSKLIKTIDNVDEYLSTVGCNRQDCFIYLKLGQNDKQVSPDNWVLPENLKNANLPQPNVQIASIKVRSSDNKTFDIEITSDLNALFVWLDAHGIDGKFSENGFLQVQASKSVIFYSDVEVSEDQLRGNLTVTHLRDPKYFPA